MPTLTTAQVAGVVKGSSWSREPVKVQTEAVAVAFAESSGRSDVRNSIGASGLWQILESAHPDLFRKYNWRNPRDNAEMAYRVYVDAGRSWSPWVAYTNGSYRIYMKRAGRAIGNPAAPPSSPGSGVSAAGFSAFDLTPIKVFWALVTDPQQFTRAGYVILGGILLFSALYVMSGRSAGQDLKTIVSVVK